MLCHLVASCPKHRERERGRERERERERGRERERERLWPVSAPWRRGLYHVMDGRRRSRRKWKWSRRHQTDGCDFLSEREREQQVLQSEALAQTHTCTYR